VFIPNNGDRTHLTAAKHGDGLRIRSTGLAAEMLTAFGHWNVATIAQSSWRAKYFLRHQQAGSSESPGE